MTIIMVIGELSGVNFLMTSLTCSYQNILESTKELLILCHTNWDCWKTTPYHHQWVQCLALTVASSICVSQPSNMPSSLLFLPIAEVQLICFLVNTGLISEMEHSLHILLVYKFWFLELCMQLPNKTIWQQYQYECTFHLVRPYSYSDHSTLPQILWLISSISEVFHWATENDEPEITAVLTIIQILKNTLKLFLTAKISAYSPNCNILIKHFANINVFYPTWYKSIGHFKPFTSCKLFGC